MGRIIRWLEWIQVYRSQKNCIHLQQPKIWLKQEDEDEFSSNHKVRVNYKENLNFTQPVPPKEV